MSCYQQNNLVFSNLFYSVWLYFSISGSFWILHHWTFEESVLDTFSTKKARKVLLHLIRKLCLNCWCKGEFLVKFALF